MKRRKDLNSDFADRLELVMNEKFIKHSPTVLANLFNPKFVGGSITPNSARNWLLGNSLPTHDKLIHLANLLDTSAEYLRYGRHTEKTFVISESDGSETELTSTQQQFLKRYLKLTEVQQGIVNSTVTEFTAKT